MVCPLCRERQARRACPAIGKRICAVCCGTKRQAEINCPPTCGYLATSLAHPAASVRKQQERDVGLVMAMREGLSNRESELYWVILTFLAGYRADPLVKVVDDDVAEAAGALASTYETANRGLIYEHRPQTLAAQRLATELKGFLTTLVAQADAAAARLVEHDAAVVFRHLERGAREARRVADEGPGTALAVIARVVAAAGQGREAAAVPEPRTAPAQPLIIKP